MATKTVQTKDLTGPALDEVRCYVASRLGDSVDVPEELIL